MGRGAGMGLGRGIMEGRMDTTKQNQGEGVDEDALDFGKGRARTLCLPSQQQEAEIWSWVAPAARCHKAWRHNDASP